MSLILTPRDEYKACLVHFDTPTDIHHIQRLIIDVFCVKKAVSSTLLFFVATGAYSQSFC